MIEHLFLAATQLLYQWFSMSVCPFVRLFSLCFHHCIIMKFARVNTIDRSDVHAKGQGHRRQNNFALLWGFPDHQFSFDLQMTTTWCTKLWSCVGEVHCCFFEVIRQISRSYRKTIADFDPSWAFPDCNSGFNSPMTVKWCTKFEVA